MKNNTKLKKINEDVFKKAFGSLLII